MLLGALAAQAQPSGTQPTLADPPDPDQIRTTVPVQFIEVDGSTLLPQADLDAVLARYQGRRLSLADMDLLTKEIESLYRERGYFLVNALVPTQDSSRGVLTINVVEGKIGEVMVEGNQRYPSEFLLARFQNAVPAQGAKTEDFQRALFLLNELPDLDMTAVLTAGEQEGTTAVTLTAQEDKNFHITAGYNNFGARLTGQHRFALGAEASSVFTPGDQLLAGGLLSTPSDGTLFAQASYSFPVSPAGTRLGVLYANGAYTAGREVAVLDIRGDAAIFGLTVSHPLTRTLTYSSDLDFRLSYNDLENRILGLPLSRDKYTSASLGYRGERRDSGGRFLGALHMTQGLGGTDAGDPLASRQGAGGDFTKFNIDLARVQELNSQWLAVLRASVQVSPDPLFSAEQFALGGPDTVRGFSQALLLGDQAYNTTLELRWSPLAEDPDLFQTVFFVDHGGVTNKRPLPGEDGSQQLTGAGLGFRLNFDQTRVRLDLGFPLSPTDLGGDSPAVYGQIETRF
jgi:hemolysin activation/secretion protein